VSELRARPISDDELWDAISNRLRGGFAEIANNLLSSWRQYPPTEDAERILHKNLSDSLRSILTERP